MADPKTNKASCKCNGGYFGLPKYGSKCMDAGKTAKKQYPCLSDLNCPKYSRCGRWSGCECRDELKGDGEICNPDDPVKCSSQSECTSAQGICYDGYCRCTGMFAGNGIFCRVGKACEYLANIQCGENTECVIDPFFPEKTECRCKIGFITNRNTGKCVECLSNGDCTKTYSKCVKEKCICEQELILGETKCEAGSDPCPEKFQCGHGTCLKDPLMPKDLPVCRCDKGYFKNNEGKCVECFSDNDCNKDYSTCDSGTCKCKDELVKEGQKICKRAPLLPCSQDGDCHNKADCIQGKCYCRGKLTGNGQFCRDSLACPAELDKCGDQDVCVVDPLFPNEPECKCREGTARTSADGKCEEEKFKVERPQEMEINQLRIFTFLSVVTECFKRGFVCPFLSSCVNIKGMYICVCKKGYELKSVGSGQQARRICQGKI
ncbi:hypothetical protein ACROYT_G023877 [Oculina patagonica]